jgi:hypothetical protein
MQGAKAVLVYCAGRTGPTRREAATAPCLGRASLEVQLLCSLLSMLRLAQLVNCLNKTCCAFRHADAITQGVPVSVLDDEYGRSTVAMAALVDKFAGLDLYDPERVKVSSHAYACNIRYNTQAMSYRSAC